MADAQQQRIQQLEAELAAVRAEMQDFSYTVSHDLRASLRHIVSYAQLVQEDAAELLPAETRGFLTTIADSARHMGLLMDGLMELSRLGTVPLQTTAVPLLPLLHSVVAELAQRYPERKVQWQLPDALPTVQADVTLLRAALLCVLDNAVKFTAHKPVAMIEVSVQSTTADQAGAAAVDSAVASAAAEASTAATGSMVCLQVTDNGAGFNPALQSKLFHPFQRLHTTKQFPGIGMGLALTRKMAQRMGAAVHAEGVPEGGCTVRLLLPAA